MLQGPEPLPVEGVDAAGLQPIAAEGALKAMVLRRSGVSSSSGQAPPEQRSPTC